MIARAVSKTDLGDKLYDIIFLNNSDRFWLDIIPDYIDSKRDSITFVTIEKYTEDEERKIRDEFESILEHSVIFLRYDFGGVYHHMPKTIGSYTELNIKPLIRDIKLKQLFDYEL